LWVALPTPQPERAIEAVSASIFALGCLGLCAMLVWLGPEGIVPGHVLFGVGFIVAMEVSDRAGAAARRAAVRRAAMGINLGRMIVGIDRSKKTARLPRGAARASERRHG
jgi:hypothetical protein